MDIFKDKKNLIELQESNDVKIKNLKCKNTILLFLLLERQRTREQIESTSNLSWFSMNAKLKELNNLNKDNLLTIKKNIRRR